MSNVETELFYDSALFDTRRAQSCQNTFYEHNSYLQHFIFHKSETCICVKRYNLARADNTCDFWNEYRVSTGLKDVVK